MKYHIEFDLELNKNPYPGLFIAFEGIDASGKSTQVERLHQWFISKGKKAVIMNPFSGEIGLFVRRILSGELKVPPVATQYLISANRAVQEQEIIEHLKKGENVIIDRYIWSAIAYGILDMGKETMQETGNWLTVGQSLLSMYHRFIIPNYTFYLDISSDTAEKRLNAMSKKKEIYEEKSKIEEVRKVYNWVLKQFAKEFTIINGQQPEEKVAEEIITYIS